MGAAAIHGPKRKTHRPSPTDRPPCFFRPQLLAPQRRNQFGTSNNEHGDLVQTAYTYTYDGNGNRSRRTVAGAWLSYSYDAENRLTRFATDTYSPNRLPLADRLCL